MNKDINEALNRIDDIISNIDTKVKAINDKLDALIQALHNYDEGKEMFEIRDHTDEALEYRFNTEHIDYFPPYDTDHEKRMDIIGQNGNEGTHYNFEKIKHEKNI